jgi:hypothetical protein
MADSDKTEAFIARWSGVTGSERANYQLFITELCALLELPGPEPAHEDTRDNAYVLQARRLRAGSQEAEGRHPHQGF